MKILFAVKTLTAQGGGAERVLASISSCLAQRGHEVIVASFDEVGSKPFYDFDSRVTIVPLHVGNVRHRTRFSEAIMRARSLRRLAKTVLPDAAVGFMHSAYVPLAIALTGMSVPTIGSEHIVYEHYRDRTLERLLLRVAARSLDGMTAVSQSMRETFPREMRAKMSVLPNPIEPIGKLADVVGKKRKRILSVGRLDVQKNHRALISAFARIADEFPDWSLRIIGEGRLRRHLENQIEQLKLTERVELPGGVKTVREEYSKAQLFVLPSTYESFGLATAEALGHGLPVIGFADCPGTNELVENDVNGLLVTGSDRVAGLAESMAMLMRSSAKRKDLGRAARPTAASLDVAAIATAWEELLNSTIAATRL